MAGITVGADFVRCKACHGWDGMGTHGSYADRTGKSTGAAARPDVSNVNLRATIIKSTPQQLFDLINRAGARVANATDNAHPDYSFLTVTQRWDLVKFLKEEFIAPAELYDLAVTGVPMQYDYPAGVKTLIKPTLTYTNIGKTGVAANGQAFYAANNCATCHGADGRLIRLDGSAFSGVGAFTRAKPHEAWVKIKFGQAGTAMGPTTTTTAQMRDLYKAMADTTLFPD